MDRKIRELHGSLQDSSNEEPPFKDYPNVLKGTGKKSGPINENFHCSLTHLNYKKSL